MIDGTRVRFSAHGAGDYLIQYETPNAPCPVNVVLPGDSIKQLLRGIKKVAPELFEEIRTEKTCIRCGGPLTANCDGVCVPCLRKQGEKYERTGDWRVFTK